MKQISAIQEAYMKANARAAGIEAAKDAIWRRWMRAPYGESATWQAAHAELGEQLATARLEAARLMDIWLAETNDAISRAVVDALPTSTRRRLGARHG